MGQTNQSVHKANKSDKVQAKGIQNPEVSQKVTYRQARIQEQNAGTRGEKL